LAVTVPELSTFWIKNLLIPYLIGGNAQQADGKGGCTARRAAISDEEAGK